MGSSIAVMFTVSLNPLRERTVTVRELVSPCLSDSELTEDSMEKSGVENVKVNVRRAVS